MIAYATIVSAFREYGPSLTADDVAQIHGLTLPGAYRVINRMVTLGILRQDKHGDIDWYQLVPTRQVQVNPADRGAILSAIECEGPISEADATKLLRRSWMACHSILEQLASEGKLIPWRVSTSLTLYGRAA